MVDVVVDAELATDQFRHARASPQVGWEAALARTAQEQLLEPVPLWPTELPWPTGYGPGGQTVPPLVIEGRPPPPHRAPVDAQPERHVEWRQAAPQELEGAPSPSFQECLASRRSHGAPPGDRLGRYLCRSQ